MLSKLYIVTILGFTELFSLNIPAHLLFEIQIWLAS